MFVKKTAGPRTVTLPDGSILTLADLPPVATRWVASRKAVVIAAVRYGLLEREEAITRYGISEEEFQSWESALNRHGIDALKTTHIQKFKQS